MDIDDTPIKDLKIRFTNEKQRRRALHRQGKCPYCKVLYSKHTCKWKGREAEYFKPPKIGEKSPTYDVLNKILVLVGDVKEYLGGGSLADLALDRAIERIEREMEEI